MSAMVAMANSNGRLGESTTRRKILKATASAGAGAATISISSSLAGANPDPKEFDLGEAYFIEAKEEYPGAKELDVPILEPCRYPVSSYTVQPDSGRLLLSSAIRDPFSAEETVVAVENTLYDGDRPFPLSRSKYYLPVAADYNHRDASYIKIEPDEESKIAVSSGSSVEDTIEISKSRVASIDRSSREDFSIETAHRSIQIPEGKEQESQSEVIQTMWDNGSKQPFTQRVTARNHGKVKIYGHPKYNILPKDPSKKLAARNLRLVKEKAPEVLVPIENGSLIAVPKDLDISIKEGGE